MLPSFKSKVGMVMDTAGVITAAAAITTDGVVVITTVGGTITTGEAFNLVRIVRDGRVRVPLIVCWRKTPLGNPDMRRLFAHPSKPEGPRAATP
ncbi:hypothetical protein [Bradyrhizobium jicamae]|uniref:hypothetical protein n=1 Tax=Bradyrhizobium jicamae TaxID=280332 RepID=UPI001BABEA60|nr:hypothetical protein [Bradyrhizobium jicamae]MBR0934325.1 hypothetical protein [Bradyrhizobium jicamae]